jgi:predicted cobalt transporter CbtA
VKTLLFLSIVLISGFAAGIIHGLVNVAVVEPYLDTAIGIETQHLFSEGKAQDTPKFWEDFSTYRLWQKEGSVVSGGILGLATGALFGVVFAYSRSGLPGQNNIIKAIGLAGIMWFTIFFIPFLKYPANPPTIGDPNTIVFRSITYAVFIALSGLGALGFSLLYKRMKKSIKLVILGYVIYISVVFVLMPPNPDPITAPTELVNGFRLTSASTMTMYWIINGIILGFLWERFKPHSDSQIHPNPK